MRHSWRMDAIRDILSDTEERLEELVYDMEADLAAEEDAAEELKRQLDDLQYQVDRDEAPSYNERH